MQTRLTPNNTPKTRLLSSNSIRLSVCPPYCCLTLANKASFKKCYTLKQRYHHPNGDLRLSLRLMDQISVVRPLKHFFLALAAVDACCCYSMRRLEQQENNDSAFKPPPPDSSQGDIVKRAAGDSGSSDINSQTFRNAERSSFAYFPEAAAA